MPFYLSTLPYLRPSNLLLLPSLKLVPRLLLCHQYYETRTFFSYQIMSPFCIGFFKASCIDLLIELILHSLSNFDEGTIDFLDNASGLGWKKLTKLSFRANQGLVLPSQCCCIEPNELNEPNKHSFAPEIELLKFFLIEAALLVLG